MSESEPVMKWVCGREEPSTTPMSFSWRCGTCPKCQEEDAKKEK